MMRKYVLRGQAGKGAGKKRCAAALLAAAVMLLAAGCGEEEKVIDGSVQNVQLDASDAGEGAEGAGDGQENGAGEANGGAQGGAGSQATGDGYVFTVNGVQVEMDADAAPILEKLGEPVSYFEAESCAFEGLDKMYTYNGFELDTYPKGNNDYVSTVIFKDDSVATAEGVAIGDSLEKLQQAYAGEGTQEDGMIVYEKGGMKLCFILNEDEIVSIEYRSTVLQN